MLRTKVSRTIPVLLLACFLQLPASAQETQTNSSAQFMAAALGKIATLFAPAPGAEPQTFSANIRFLKSDGLPKEVQQAQARVAFQAPDRATVKVDLEKRTYTIGRSGQELWIHAPAKTFGVIGRSGLPRFASAPEKLDTTTLAPFKLPIPSQQLILAPLLFRYEPLPDETIGGEACALFRAVPLPEAKQALKIPSGTLTLAVRKSDSLLARIGWSDDKKVNVLVQLENVKLEPFWPAEKWKIPAVANDHIDTVPLGHLTRFLRVAVSSLGEKIPTLPETLSGRKVLATSGQGRLELIDDTRVLIVKGTPEEMGQQQGTLLKKQIRSTIDHILYGVGVGSSFEKGRWFFSEIESAQARLKIDERYLREMDAMASAAGVQKEEVRLANFFPELFHCSGFALFGKATKDGKLYHGRILDYLKGIGLEQNAVVMVMQPDRGNAWVNISYAGFIGSVTGMNAKHISIGEMGGRGEGKWDGKPMAQLLREVMENASTLDEALAIMRKGPRTCEYYYVLSDANLKRAVGIAATPESFETVLPGQAHARLPHPIEDAVLMSAGDRYENLVTRVKAGHGKFDPQSARELMTRPVAMRSNIHSVLFEPESLDFWVANADSKNVASHTRYTKYNLGELLKGPPNP